MDNCGPGGDVALLWQDIIKCQLCLSTMNDPRSLPCLHSYCLTCLEEWAKGSHAIICPYCRAMSTPNSISSLPVDFKVAKLIDSLKLNQSVNSHPSPDRTANMCIDHQRPWELFCSADTCLKPICYKCSITTHRNHSMAEIADHFNSLLDELSKVQLRTHETIGNLNSYSNKITKLETIGEKLKIVIDNVVSELLNKDCGNTDLLDSTFKAQIEENFFQLHELQGKAGEVKQKLMKEMTNPNKSSERVKDIHVEVNNLASNLGKLCLEANARIEKDMLSDQELERFSNLCGKLLTVEKDGDSLSTEGAYSDNGMSGDSGSGSSAYRPPKVKLVFKAVNFPLEHHVCVQDGAVVENKMFIIDKSNHWAKAYDLNTGRYLYISHRQIIRHPYRLCALPLDNKLLLMEQKSDGNGVGSGVRVLSTLNLDLKKKEPFVPEISGTLWEVATCAATGIVFLVIKPGSLYRQVERRSTKFEFLFECSTSVVSKLAVCPVSGNIAVANNHDCRISVFDGEGNFLWKYPDGFKVNFKRLQSIVFDFMGNLLAVDHYYQQVQIISKRGSMLKMLHGRGLKFTQPLCAVPINTDELGILAESGDVVVVDSYIKYC